MELKVANVIEDGRLAGPQVRIAMVAGQLRRYQIDTTVIYPDFDNTLFKHRLEAMGVLGIQLPIHRLTRQKKDLLLYFLCFGYELWLLTRLFRKAGFDIVHVSGGAWQYKGVIAGKLAGCKVVWHLNDTSMLGIIRMIFRGIAKWWADGLIVAGSRVRQYYVNELGVGSSKPVIEIQAPVDCSHFDPQSVVPDKRIFEIEGLKIISVGNVNPLKGLEYFLSMAALLNQEHKGELHFFIVGPHWSSQRAYLKKLEYIKAEKNLRNVSFYGSSSDVRRIHKAADIYVCSSLAEASPLSVWEAMAMEKAIVATDVGDISRFITHGENGYIVAVADPAALAYYVGKLVQDPDLRKRFGKKARLAALMNLDISNVARKHVEAYRWVAEGRGLKNRVRRTAGGY